MLQYVPVLGRLGLTDYLRLFLAVSILILEPIFRFIFAIFSPLSYVADKCRYVLTRGRRSSDANGASDPSKRLEKVLESLNTTEDFVRFWGYPFQHHYLTTQDGYILALHRIPCSKAESDKAKSDKTAARRAGRVAKSSIKSELERVSLESNGTKRTHKHLPASGDRSRPVVILWHGFLMSSEVWVCTPHKRLSLALTLADAGYDVWLGNTRGNKYSCKHRNLKPTEEAFWDFSMDHLAFYDLPDAVSYILKVTGQPSLTYIGFSQGSAQGFSSLSIHPKLNRKINLFIALAPAAKPRGLSSNVVGTMINISPEIIYLLFGRKSLLSIALFWQNILSPPTFALVIDTCISFLFKWKADMVENKNVCYRHLYSYTSVKCVVHWFQIIRNGRFQMYDENPAVIPASSGHLVPKFPTEHIQTPIALFYGGKDTLADMNWLLKETSTPVYCLKVDEYEHICFLWSRGVDKVVYPAVLGLLGQYSETAGQNYDVSSDDVASNDARTVPWISQGQISKLMHIGRGKLSANDEEVIFEGHVSAARVLAAATKPPWQRTKTEYDLGRDPSRIEGHNSGSNEEFFSGDDRAILAAMESSSKNVADKLVTDAGKGGGRRASSGRIQSNQGRQRQKNGKTMDSSDDQGSSEDDGNVYMAKYAAQKDVGTTVPWSDASPVMRREPTPTWSSKHT